MESDVQGVRRVLGLRTAAVPSVPGADQGQGGKRREVRQAQLPPRARVHRPTRLRRATRPVECHHRRCAQARHHPRAAHRALRTRALPSHRYPRSAELPPPGGRRSHRRRQLPRQLRDEPLFRAVHPHRTIRRARTPRRRANHLPPWRPGRLASGTPRMPPARHPPRARTRRHRAQCPAHPRHSGAVPVHPTPRRRGPRPRGLRRTHGGGR